MASIITILQKNIHGLMEMATMEHRGQERNKNTLLLILWLVICGFGCSQEQLNNQSISIPAIYIHPQDTAISVDNDGLIIYNGKSFSGNLVTYYSGNKLQSTIPYFEGKKCGEAFTLYESGDTLMVRTYKNGEKHGEHRSWYPNGQLKFRYFFENGLSVGNHKSWYEDGRLSKDLNFKNGYEYGAQKMYRPDGKLRSNYVVRENGRKYGLVGLKRCAKLDSNTGNIDPYNNTN